MKLPKEVEEAIDIIWQLSKQGGTEDEYQTALVMLKAACAEPDLAKMTLMQLRNFKVNLLEQMYELEDE